MGRDPKKYPHRGRGRGMGWGVPAARLIRNEKGNIRSDNREIIRIIRLYFKTLHSTN